MRRLLFSEGYKLSHKCCVFRWKERCGIGVYYTHREINTMTHIVPFHVIKTIINLPCISFLFLVGKENWWLVTRLTLDMYTVIWVWRFERQDRLHVKCSVIYDIVAIRIMLHWSPALENAVCVINAMYKNDVCYLYSKLKNIIFHKIMNLKRWRARVDSASGVSINLNNNHSVFYFENKENE